jgi:uncharacterized membrane protein
MQRVWEILLGLRRGFLSQQGDFALSFNPQWPGQSIVGAGVWNVLLAIVAVLLVIYVYRHEGKSRGVKIVLGVMRAALLALVIALLNRPVLTLGQSRTEPSVVAIMIDDSISMRVRDVAANGSEAQSRLEGAMQLLGDKDRGLIKDLSSKHTVKLYRFDSTAQPITRLEGEAPAEPSSPTTQTARREPRPPAIEPTGQNTQVAKSIRGVLDDLQGQRLAGVVVLTDGRDTPAEPLAEALDAVKDYGVKVYPVAVGSESAPKNIDIQSVSVQESAFKGDIVNIRVAVRGTGFEPNHAVTLLLKDKKTGKPMLDLSGNPVQAKVNLPDSNPVEAELQFQPADVGPLDLTIEAVKQAGEIDDADNIRTAQISVLDAKISVLYVDGYPRWEYRYLKTEMIRDKTVDISCLLTSADPTFRQEGDKPITRFPESIEEMLDYDVVIFGDVDPRQFSDAQLQLVNDFVANRGGGFGMVAGTRWSPAAYHNTAIEPILPVNITKVQSEDARTSITQGFRPAVTKLGLDSSIFRFFADRAANEKFLKDQIQLIFWYCHGVTTKAGVGEVYAEHPSDVGPDGRKAPLLVLGRFGAGRTLFSAIDDSWRWRFYTGESVFDTYWVQQLRYLARSKKLGQRRLTFTSLRPTYELGQQVRVQMRVLDPKLLQQLPNEIRVEVTEEGGEGSAVGVQGSATNPTTAASLNPEPRTPNPSAAVVRQETLMKEEGQPDLYVASWTADRIGRFTAKLPPIVGGVDEMNLPIEVMVPRLELAQPQVDRASLNRLATETMGQTVDLADAGQKLPTLIQSAAKVIPIETSQRLWDAPLVLILFVFLITTEWVMRKIYGMV